MTPGKNIRLAVAIVCGLLTAGGEAYAKYVAKDEVSAGFILVIGLLAIVVSDQVVQVFGKEPEDVGRELKDLLDRMNTRSSSDIGDVKKLITDVAGLLRSQKQLDLELLGNDEQALNYVLRQYTLSRQGSPKIVKIRDTHIRKERRLKQRYDPHVLQMLEEEFGSFLKRGGTCELIIGWTVDENYMHMVHSAAEKHQENLACYRFLKPGAVMNFILLVYDDGSREVLFGWGQGADGKVFKSTDQRVVGEFDKFYDVLISIAEHVPMRSLLEHPAEQRAQASLGILEPYDHDKVGELFRSSPPDAHLRIFISFFVDQVDLFQELRDALIDSRRTLTILMLDPDADVLKMRYGTTEQPIRRGMPAKAAREQIITQLHRLTDMQSELNRKADEARSNNGQPSCGALDLRVYGCAPTIAYYSSDHEALLGVLLLHESANKGPWVRIKRGEPLWASLIEENWNTVLSVSTPPKQAYSLTAEA